MAMAGEKAEVTEIIKDDNATPIVDPYKLDVAAKFLDEHYSLDTSQVDLKRLRRKIDWNILPIMVACFLCQYLDKSIYNYTAVMGLPKDLKFHGQDFSNVASAYAFAYLAMQFPNSYIVQRLPAAKWLGACVIAWGIVTACTAAVQNYWGMLATRVFLAAAEATISPSLMLLTSQYYTKSEQATRFGLWHCAPGLSQILGGLISYGFQAVQSETIAGWRLMFIALGAVTIIVGLLTIRFLPDTPMQAKFLTDAEKLKLLRHMSVNMTGIVNRKFEISQVWEAIKDPQVFLLCFSGTLAGMTIGLTGTYSTTLIKKMGVSEKNSALLNMPCGATGIAASLIAGYGIRKTSNRWLWCIGVSIPSIIGSCLLSFLPQPNLAGSLAGLYLIPAITAVLTITQMWSMSNVAGHSKRAFTAGAMTAIYGISGVVSPQTFRKDEENDKPVPYLSAKITVMATQVGAAVMYVILFLYYYFENKRRDRLANTRVSKFEDNTEEKEMGREDAWLGKTDKENPNFRYVY